MEKPKFKFEIGGRYYFRYGTEFLFGKAIRRKIRWEEDDKGRHSSCEVYDFTTDEHLMGDSPYKAIEENDIYVSMEECFKAILHEVNRLNAELYEIKCKKE